MEQVKQFDSIGFRYDSELSVPVQHLQRYLLYHRSSRTIRTLNLTTSQPELKEFEQRLKYGWYHLKLY